MKIQFIKSFCGIVLLGLLPLSGQEKDVVKPLQVQVVYETFSLSRGEAARSQREAQTDGKLYARLVSRIDKGEVRQEKLLVIRALAGRESRVEHVSELIFPQAYDPPELPNQVGSGIQINPTYREAKKGKVLPLSKDQDLAQRGDGWQEGTIPATPASATSTTTLKMGDSLEIEAKRKAPGLIALTFKAVHTGPAGFDHWGQNLAKVVMPRFEQQELQSDLILKNGKPSLVGTVSPEPVQEAGDEKEIRVWFAFVTASVVKPG